MVEKPPQGTEPSNLIISGRYILQPEIFDLLGNQEKGAGGEIQLTDAMARLMKTQDFHALEYDGVTYDCGDKIGLLRANVAFALKRPDLAEAARERSRPCSIAEDEGALSCRTLGVKVLTAGSSLGGWSARRGNGKRGA